MDTGEPGPPAAPASEQAYCARHPQTRAVLTCERCGDYACAACAGPRDAPQRLCKNCFGSSYEELRKEYGPHERQVRAIALLNWLGAFFMALGGLAMVAAGVAAGAENGMAAAVMGALFVPFAGLSGVTAWQLQKFTTLGRVLAAISAVLGLCSVPFGTLISAFILWVLLGKKGEVVFSERYRAAIAATPHLRFGVSMVTKVVLGMLMLLMVGGGIAAAVLGK